MDDSTEMQMLPEHSPSRVLPRSQNPNLKQRHIKPNSPSLSERGTTKPGFDLQQGNSTLAAYIQTAASLYQDTTTTTRPNKKEETEEQFVNAFIHGLSKTRDRKKCEKNFGKGVAKTWEGLKECFPVASQQQQQKQGHGQDLIGRDLTGDRERKRKRDRVETETEMEKEKRATTTTSTLPPLIPLPHLEKREHAYRGGGGEEQAEGHAHAPAEQTEKAEKCPRVVPEAGPQSTLAAAVESRALAQQEIEPVRNQGDEALPAAKKMRTKTGKRRRERRPSIPILPSSDDEFSRGCRS